MQFQSDIHETIIVISKTILTVNYSTILFKFVAKCAVFYLRSPTRPIFHQEYLKIHGKTGSHLDNLGTKYRYDIFYK